ncbi:ABC transporter permease [Paraburkholderia bannensis]|uniref:ABC transporter permease n=1 Tax=Paraburkholderia bannensis TaxID=765414 RepID=UPI002AC3721D|nr:ABC transporter permease [Paraburkholderia bannensis]
MIVVYAFFAFAGQGGFLTVTGTASWMNTAAELGVLAVPVGILMIAGEFDLSVGSVVGASSMVVSIGNGYYGWPIWVAIVAALLVGAFVGLVNGLITVKTGLPSFIVTLAGLFIVAGAALGLSRFFVGTTAVTLSPQGSAKAIFGAQVAGFHGSILWWLAITGITTWILARTPYGSWIYATGANRNAARSAGVPTDLVKISLFMGSSIAAALVGVLQTIQYSGGDVTYGRDFVFAAPVASVIGGVLLTGGYGSAIGVFLGCVIFGVVNLGIFYTGWNSDWAQLVLGALLLLAVLGNNYFRRLALMGR